MHSARRLNGGGHNYLEHLRGKKMYRQALRGQRMVNRGPSAKGSKDQGRKGLLLRASP